MDLNFLLEQVKPVKPVTTLSTYVPTTLSTTTVRTNPPTTSLSTFPTTTVRTTEESLNILSHTPAPGRSTVSASRSSECGVPTMARPETRIVGGKNAPFGRWPWQVSVRRTSFFGFSSTHRCGGAVINENWIATAGHCVDE